MAAHTSSTLPAAPAGPAGAQTPRRLRRAEDILSMAREVFLEKGFAGSSIGEIAAKVGVVEGLLYTYYPSKRELLNAVLLRMYEPIITDLEQRFARLQGVRSRLRFLVWRHIRVYIEEPRLSRLILHEVRTGPEYFQSVLHDLHVRYTSFLLRTAQDGIADGELRPDTDLELLRSMVYGGIEHRMWGTLFGRGSVDVEDMADRYTDLVLVPLLARPQMGTAPERLTGPSDLAQLLAQAQDSLTHASAALAAARAIPRDPPPPPASRVRPARAARHTPP